MSRALALLVIGLVFGGGIGFVLAAANGVTLDGHDHATDHSNHGTASKTGHDHSEVLEVDGVAPTLMIHVMEDPVSGWNLHVMTTNFTFAPLSVGGDHVEGEGHAHVYANGAKLARLYGPWMHIDALPAGDVELLVTLNSNDHRALAVDGATLEATQVIAQTD